MRRLLIAVACAGLFFAGAAFAGQPGDGNGPPDYPPGQDECSRGNSDQECRPDPSTSGQDCDQHGGNQGANNEDHCLSGTTTDPGTTTEPPGTTEEPPGTTTTPTPPSPPPATPPPPAPSPPVVVPSVAEAAPLVPRATKKKDLCLNVPGLQTKVGKRYVRTPDGRCVRKTDPFEVSTTQVPVTG